MSRLVHFRDMTASEIIRCNYDALAIVELCEFAANDLSERAERMPEVLGSIGTALALVKELLGPVLDTLEVHEGQIDGERHEHASTRKNHQVCGMRDGETVSVRAP